MSQTHTFEYKSKSVTYIIHYKTDSFIHLYEEVFGRQALIDNFFDFISASTQYSDMSDLFNCYIRGCLIAHLRG